jgi:hypothetical protein
MTQERKTTILRQLDSDLAIVDSALSELEERRTAIIHRIVSHSSSGSRPPGILQFPGALSVDTYTERTHVWSANPNSHPRASYLPKKSKKKPATAKSQSSRSTTT